MIKLKEGINKNLLVSFFIDLDLKTIKLFISSKRILDFNEILSFLKTFLQNNNNISYTIIKDDISYFYTCTINLDYEYLNNIIKLIKESKFIYKSEENLEVDYLLDGISFLNREFIPIDSSLPILLITFGNKGKESKIKIYDYRFELDNKFFYKGGRFINAYSSRNEYNS